MNKMLSVLCTLIAAIAVGCGNDVRPDATGQESEPPRTSTTSAATAPNPPSAAPASSVPSESSVALPPDEMVVVPGLCENQRFLYPRGLGWVLNSGDFTVTACREGKPISTITAGPGEVFFSMDSNQDGVEELVVGGTSVGGGGGLAYTLLGDELVSITTQEGAPFSVQFGHVNESVSEYGCRGQLIIQVRATTSGMTATADRTSYLIEGDRARIIDHERIAWTLSRTMSAGELWSEWETEHPPELTNDLSDCFVAPSYDQVVAAKNDGTVLLGSMDTIPDDASRCGERMALNSWNSGVIRLLGFVNGRPVSAGLPDDDGNMAMVVHCNGDYMTVEANWGDWWLDTSQPEEVSEPPSFRLSGTPSLSLVMEELPLTEETCEVSWEPRRLFAESNSSESIEWKLASGEPLLIDWIDFGGFLSTTDGRFVLVDTPTCVHDTPIVKTVYRGTYDTATGALTSIERIEPSEDFVAFSGTQFVRTSPDSLSVDNDNRIVGWLGTGTDVISTVLSEVGSD